MIIIIIIIIVIIIIIKTTRLRVVVHLSFEKILTDLRGDHRKLPSIC